MRSRQRVVMLLLLVLLGWEGESWQGRVGRAGAMSTLPTGRTMADERAGRDVAFILLARGRNLQLRGGEGGSGGRGGRGGRGTRGGRGEGETVSTLEQDGSSVQSGSGTRPKREFGERDGTSPGAEGILPKKPRTIDRPAVDPGQGGGGGGQSAADSEHPDGCESPSILQCVQSRNLNQLRDAIVRLRAMGDDEVTLETDARDLESRTALHVASLVGDPDATRLLLECGAKQSSVDRDGRSPLHLAAGAGHTSVLAVLIASGADMNAGDQGGWTALHHAAAAGNREAFKVLAEGGADMMATSLDGKTAFEVGREHGFELVPEWKAGEGDVADLMAVFKKVEEGETGTTDVHKGEDDAEEGGEDDKGGWSDFLSGEEDQDADGDESSDDSMWDEESVEEEGEGQREERGGGEGDGVDDDDVVGRSKERDVGGENIALHQACMSGDHASIPRLCDGADVDSIDGRGRTGLLVASAAGHEKVVTALLGLGANVSSRDDRGR
jgi:hypothetical protein